MKGYIEQIKSDGTAKFAIKALKFILRKSMGFSWDRLIMVERLLEEPIQDIEPKVKIDIREATMNDLDNFREVVDAKKWEFFRERFEKGKICFVASDKGKIIHFSWIDIEDGYESISEIKLKLGEKEAYYFDAYTLPQYRQNRLYSAISIRVLRYLRNKGYKKVFGLVSSENVYSRKTLKKIGYKGKKIVTVFMLFWLRFYIWRKFEGDLWKIEHKLKI